MKPFVPHDHFQIACTHYNLYNVKGKLRLGQYLMNECAGGETDSEIYYEYDDEKASKMFYEKYVIKDEN